ncbi:MAG: DUF2628 domain-containing protein [Clostridiales bacterium]|nr:DUF2628 domain-containing protein [Clostridiales bacterium]
MSEKSNDHLELNDEEKLIETNSSYYIEKFNKMRDKNTKFSWNWASFMLSNMWFFYRKMYFIGTIIVSINIGLFFLGDPWGYVSDIIAVISGIGGNYLYMKHIEKVINNSKDMTDFEKEEFIKNKAGTNIIAPIFTFVLIFTVFAKKYGLY